MRVLFVYPTLYRALDQLVPTESPLEYFISEGDYDYELGEVKGESE